VDTIEAATGGIPELSAPKMKVVLLATDEQWVLARIIGQRARDYEAHEQKPYRSSSALPVQLARGIINLLPASAQTVLDPCCGSGTLPVEAASLGYQVSCGDQSPKMAWITRRNLEYFGFPPEAVCQDARDWVGRFDAVVTDVPYGLVNNPRTEKEPVVASILHHLPALTSFALVVAHGDLSSVLLEAGFDRVDVFRVGKFTKLVRHIHRARMG
jgi:tRNA G10  N-methylase Trm11